MSIKQFIGRAILKLPEPWIVRLAGGEQKIDGQILDPYIQLMLARTLRQPSIEGMTPSNARLALQRGLSLYPPPVEPGVAFEDRTVTLEGYDLSVRIYRPEDQDPAASLMVYYHGGGGVLGDLDTAHGLCSVISGVCRRPVVSVAYRLAPEHTWPAAVEDAIASYEWALREAELLGAPPAQAAVGGDCLGGNLAAIVAQEAVRRGAPSPNLQLLIYPVVDFQSDMSSISGHGGVPPLTHAVVRYFLDHYLPEQADLDDPWLSPLRVTSLHDLPQAVIVSAGLDIHRDQARLYHERLVDAGVTSTYRCFDGLVHGFANYAGASPAAARACREIAGLVVAARR